MNGLGSASSTEASSRYFLTASERDGPDRNRNRLV